MVLDPGTVATSRAGALRTREQEESLALLLGAAEQIEERSISERTRSQYAKDWARYEGWCTTAGVQPLGAQPDEVRAYLASMVLTLRPDGSAQFKASTIERHLASIGHYFTREGLPAPARDPQIAVLMKGIRRVRGTRPRQMRALVRDDNAAILASMEYSTWPSGFAAARDALAVLLGFAGALRRSELAALRNEQVTWDPYDGLRLYIEKSKSDQEGQGVVIPLPFGRNPGTCPVCAYVRWTRLVLAAEEGREEVMRLVLSSSEWEQWQHVCREGIPEIEGSSPVLRAIWRSGALGGAVSGDALYQMLKRRAAEAGFTSKVGFHSLRAGFVTEARRNGADARSVRRQTRHGSDAMVDVYDREHSPLLNNAVNDLGL